MKFYKSLARRIPNLKVRLMQARMNDSPEYYVKKTFMTALFLTLAICFIAFMFSNKWIVFLFSPIIMFFAFNYFIHYVDMRIKKYKDSVSKEIVFAGRFLLVELESGVPMFNAFKNMSKHYEAVGMYFQDIVDKVELGTPMDEALNETVNITASPDLRRILWQLLNSLKTGSSVTTSLTSVFEQIVREQQIAVEEYGRKLNPLAMFYMMMAIIIPSLGTIMLVVMATFMGFPLNMTMLLLIIGALWFMQFMFLAMIRSSRPPVDL